MGDDNATSLQEKLNLYTTQLETVNTALELDTENVELLKASEGLIEVIDMTKNLLNIKLKEEEAKNEALKKTTSVLPAVSEDNIKWKVGDKVEAKYSSDGKWYKSVIESFRLNEDDELCFTVVFEFYGNKEEVRLGDMRSVNLSAATLLENKRKFSEIQEIPERLKVVEGDSIEIRASKKRKVKAIKSKNRIVRLENDRNKKKNAWQKFQTKQGKKSVLKTTAGKRESIFRSPDTVEGKVGVTGSGNALTAIPVDPRIAIRKNTKKMKEGEVLMI